MAHKAKVGGEIGANGEYYKGGQYVADCPDRVKGVAPVRTSHKIEIEPYTWVIADSDEFSVMSLAKVGAVSAFIKANGWRDYSELRIVDNAAKLCELNSWDIAEIASAVERYNNGERIYRR